MAGKKIRLLLLFFKLLVDNRHQSHGSDRHQTRVRIHFGWSVYTFIVSALLYVSVCLPIYTMVYIDNMQGARCADLWLWAFHTPLFVRYGLYP